MKALSEVLLLAAIFISVSANSIEAVEPEYEGKAFSFWFRDLSLGGSRSVEGLERSKVAIRSMGTNVLPLLLDKMSATNFGASSGENLGLSRCFEALGPMVTSAIPQLMEILRPAEPSTRAFSDEGRRQTQAINTAADALVAIGPAAWEQLTNRLATGDKEWRMGVMVAVERFSYRNAALVRPVLLQALQDSDPGVRMRAAQTLGWSRVAADVVVPALMEAARDMNASVRFYAFQALGRYGPEARAAVPLLLEAARTQSIGHGGPVAALKQIDPTNAVDGFMAFLADKNPKVREQGLRALGEFGATASRAVPAVLGLLQSQDFRVRSAAEFALVRMGPDALAGVIGLFQHSNAAVRLKAVATLWTFGTDAHSAIPELEKLRSDPAEKVRQAAESRLKEFNLAVEKANAPFKSTIVRRPVRVPADDQKEEPLSVEQLEKKATTAISKLQQPETRVEGFSELVELQPGWVGCATTDGSLAARQILHRVQTNIHACPDLSGVISSLDARLEKPETRLQALATLLKFGGPYQSMGSVSWGGSGDARFDDAVRQANAAVAGCRDVETVEKALESADARLRLWAVMKFSPDFISKSDWERLAPKFKKVAAEDNVSLRALAVERLAWFAGTSDFLDERIQIEASPDVLMRLVSGRDKREFLALFRPLLDHQDERIRSDALRFIGEHWNPSRAPMWQFPFGRDVCDRVLELSRSESVQERSDATHALRGLKQMEPERRREALLRLIKDTNLAIRGTAAWGLAKEKDHPEVTKALAGLLAEPSPSLRYTAILILGATNYVRELQELTHCADARVADDAKRQLDWIEKRK